MIYDIVRTSMKIGDLYARSLYFNYTRIWYSITSYPNIRRKTNIRSTKWPFKYLIKQIKSNNRNKLFARTQNL